MAVLASVIVCSLCMFFLIPRSITLTSSSYEIVPYHSYMNESEAIIKLSFVVRVLVMSASDSRTAYLSWHDEADVCIVVWLVINMLSNAITEAREFETVR